MAAVAPVVLVAAGGESWSTVTGGDLWVSLILSVDAFLAVSAMSSDAVAGVRGMAQAPSPVLEYE